MNGNGRIEGLLERIATTLEFTREEMTATREEIGHLRTDMNRGFAQVNARVDNALAIAGRHHDDHEQRIQVLEAAVLGKRSG